jgi:hypothetical protein
LSPAAALALAFILGAVIGGVGGYLGAHTPIGQPAVVATPAVSASSSVYIVTGISGSTIQAIGTGGAVISIHTTGTTSYQEGGLPATFKDIKLGLQILVKGKTGTKFVRTATRILLIDPTVAGTIQTITSSGIVISVGGGSTVTISITPGTRIVMASTSKPVALTSLHRGEKVKAYGKVMASGIFGAAVIDITP